MGTGKDASEGWWRSLMADGPFIESSTPSSSYYMTRDMEIDFE